MLCRHSIHRSSRLRTHFSDLIYGGFIMTDYRNIATKDGILRNAKNQHYTASMGYSNALDLLFANVKHPIGGLTAILRMLLVMMGH